ncbi:iron-containing alcohol dehydrogenase [Amycolatopsis sp. K13G38]|uniref:hydroxyacid-oxoacid transhydrogenase n=1 Tax=Amycolatopsis acididurans TaxID=2724524 RepID=A0ABX1J1R6_9PSEU|nr:hydroxyacid-oxoacid transhydrogenase [Amycolatopsis acididurans]NKQ52295.1 iron-containing alcohol dehydrogenase [Amycolatopsis acididurans]
MVAGNDGVFTWAAPPLKFGVAALDEIGLDARTLGLRDVLLVTDAGVRETGVPDRVRDTVQACGVKCEVFDGVAVEPTDVSIADAVSRARERPWDGLIAVGGGSAIDTAKAVNLLATHGGDLLDYVTPPVGAGKAPPAPLKPLIAVPTTAGTGSESTAIAVVDLLSARIKAGVSHPWLRPALAVVDPQVTVSLPPEVTAASGMDVLSHALESYTAIRFDTRAAPAEAGKRPAFSGANPISDGWCEQALRLVGRYLRAAVFNGRDLEARYHMALASTCAGTGFGNAGTHLPHAAAYPIAGMVDAYQPAGYPAMPMVPHGQAVAITAPAVFEWTYPAGPDRHLRAAELLTGETFSRADGAQVLPSVLRELMTDIEMPTRLRAFGYGEDDVEALIDGTLRQTRQLGVVPRPVTREALARILRACL